MVGKQLISRHISSNSCLFATIMCFLILIGLNCRLAPTETAKPSPTQSLFPLVVTDSNGLKVTFSRPPTRIVTYDSAPVEILFSMGEGWRIVGTHEFVTYPPEVSAIPKVGDAFNINQERIIELEPDLIFTFYDGSLQNLQHLGAKVLYLEAPSTLDGISDRIRLWGLITGNISSAEKIATAFDARIATLQKRVNPVESGPRVFQDNSEFWTPGPNTLVGNVYTLLKAQNIARSTSGYTQLSPEVIVERDPEVIIVTFPDTKQVYADDPAFKNVSAVIESRVFAIDTDLLSIAGPRVLDGIEELARIIHPEIFDQ